MPMKFIYLFLFSLFDSFFVHNDLIFLVRLILVGQILVAVNLTFGNFTFGKLTVN